MKNDKQTECSKKIQNKKETKNMRNGDKEYHCYLYQAIFERRKTQYITFLFFLTATGACGGLVLTTEKPEEHILSRNAK